MSLEDGIVVFSYADWVGFFPELSSVSEPLVGMYWELAGLVLNNTSGSVIPYAVRRNYLNLLTAHLTSLFGPVGGVPSATLVGRISDATQGSISVSAEFIAAQNAQWYNQTKYGALYWVTVANYRTARYFAGPGVRAPVQWPPFRTV